MASTWLFVLLLVSIVHASLEFKKLAGPPTEFTDFEAPNPLSIASVQHSAVFQIDLLPNLKSKVINQQVKLPVDSENEFKVNFFSPFSDIITLSLADPFGRIVSLTPISTFIPMGDVQVPCTSYIITGPVQGEYVLGITSTKLSDSAYRSITTNTVADVYIILWNEDSIALHTTLNTHKLVVGQKIGLVSRLIDSSVSRTRGELPTAINQGFVIEGDMRIVMPNGKLVKQTMFAKDKYHTEAFREDGVFSGLITATLPGLYTFSATLNGTKADGVPYLRTTTKVVQVVDASVILTGASYGILGNSRNKMTIKIGVSAPVGQKYHAFAQVWGLDESQQEVPISWIGGMAIVEEGTYGYGLTLNLELDFNWLSMAKSRNSLTLRKVAIKDPSSFIVIAEQEEMPVRTSFSIKNAMSDLALLGDRDDITLEMREGKIAKAKKAVAGPATLLLVHGYCSSSNPWEVSPVQWTGSYAYFRNLQQSISNDAFALLIADFGAQYGAFSAIGHSQGGLALLHLYTYYYSGLDDVVVPSGKRLLQSVGSPYQGSSLAGNWAAIGQVFGTGCGTCYDLTHDGAAIWLSAIPTYARQKVYYYTTTYKLGTFFGDYCSLPANAILSFPNDGTAELDYAQLPSGNYMGNTQKQCHISGMGYMAQTSDTARNFQMNANAAR